MDSNAFLRWMHVVIDKRVSFERDVETENPARGKKQVISTLENEAILI